MAADTNLKPAPTSFKIRMFMGTGSRSGQHLERFTQIGEQVLSRWQGDSKNTQVKRVSSRFGSHSDSPTLVRTNISHRHLSNTEKNLSTDLPNTDHTYTRSRPQLYWYTSEEVTGPSTTQFNTINHRNDV